MFPLLLLAVSMLAVAGQLWGGFLVFSVFAMTTSNCHVQYVQLDNSSL